MGTQPWDRQPDETDKAWRAFVTYRDMDNRTLEKVAPIVGTQPAAVEKLSARWGWRSRCDAWDRERDRMERDARAQAQRDAIKSMTERHTAIASSMQRLATVELGRVMNRLGVNQEKPNLAQAPQLSIDQIKTLIDYAIKLERLNRGEPGEINENRQEVTTWAEIVAAAREVAGQS